MFLGTHEARPLRQDAPAGFTEHELFLGKGSAALEVAVFRATSQPTAGELQRLHDKRKGGRASPVIVVALWGTDRAALVTSTGLEPFARVDLERGQVERILDAALGAPSHHVAMRQLLAAIDQLNSPIPGVRNSGLFAFHVLQHRARSLPTWNAADREGRGLLALRGRDLVTRLGYRIDTTARGGSTCILVAAGTKLAVAVFLDRSDEIEASSPLFDHLSPVSFALARADQEHLDYVVVAAGSKLRIYPVKPGVGTGRRGRTETFVELDLALLREADAGYLTLLASAGALGDNGAFQTLLGASREFAVDLGTRLRDRVYEDVVPRLATAIVRARKLRNPSAERLAETYEMSLVVLFRLLFVAYAEDKELLPLHSSPSYRAHSLKEIALRLEREREKGEAYGKGDHYWTEVAQLWKAIDQGNTAWHVPAYNGGLFAAGDDARTSAQALAKLALPDDAFAPALQALLLDESTEGGRGPIDFRSLGVREFGTIYEGLLEQELAVADSDLSVDKKTGAYVPAKGKAGIVVREGEVYLHNASGARKASGAYYTKDFAVEHLLEHALDPALDDHLARIAGVLDDRDASERFFDFHVADIAMGSGHFLVAAIDHMERKFSGYLARRALPGVKNELERLRETALEQLGAEYLGEPLEDTLLLRRQIARRCVFGVDLNPLAVELARLSIWIHTFVPGLPLSFLDQNLVCGNALVGIATFDEVRELLEADDGGLFALTADELVGTAREPLAKLAKLADATAAEVKEAKKLYQKARSAIRDTEDLFTVLTASRIDDAVAGPVKSKAVTVATAKNRDVFFDGLVRKSEKALKGLKALHFPIAFPQVFLGSRPGFDVILGNPPWEKLHVEDHEFWARYYPGFRGLTQAERERRWPAMRRARPDLTAAFEAERDASDRMRDLLLKGPYPGMGSGHPDLYKAFCWRFWHLVNGDGGSLGVVLPRAVFAAKGSEEFRRELFGARGNADVTTLVNSRGWVFDNVDPRYTIALAAVRRGEVAPREVLALRGPYVRRDEFTARRVSEAASFDYSAVRKWNDSIALPLLPSDRSGEVFAKLRRQANFGEQDHRAWRARPLQGDLNATTGQEWMDFKATPSSRRWPVYAGESFDLWTPDTGKYYAVAESGAVLAHLQERRERAGSQARSAFSAFAPNWLRDPKSLPCRHPRIAFRDVTRATDTRTMRVALVPPNVLLTHKAPFFLWPQGTFADQAFLLGVLASLPLDWYCRRFVEVTMSFELLSGFPVPVVASSSAMASVASRIAARLATPDDRFEEWAAHFGLEPRQLAADEKEDHINELDAAVAHLYALDERDLVHIFETFHEGWDYEPRLQRTLKHFHRLARNG